MTKRLPVVLLLLLLPLTSFAVPTTGFRFVDIPGSDGTVLKANYIAPTTPGPHPAVVFISSWGLNDLEYLAQAKVLAEKGYVALSYTPRGFWASGGGIDTAGPVDIADTSRVLDWMLANTTANPSRIGLAGVSYGAGIALITSGFDSRVKAVAALSGWSDLVASLFGGETRRPQAVALLNLAATLLGRPSPELTTTINDYFANRNIESIKAWGRVRSAATYIQRINANRPAILMANAYGDSLFPPNQLVSFYGQLAGPKRLEFAPGDHAVVEATGLLGLPNGVWTSVTRWMDQYVAGVDTGISREAPVVLRTHDGDTEGYASWAQVSTGTQRYGLGAIRLLDGTGTLGGTPASSASRTVWSGFDTNADAGVALLTNGLQALTGIPPIVWLPGVNRLNAGVWTSSTTLSGISIRGSATLRLRVTPSTSSGTVVAYLYDLLGDYGGLITHVPLSWKGATPGVPLDLDLAFPATAYDVPVLHRLALVVDTEDPLYLDANTTGATLSLGAPSWLDLPIR
ncbi:acyl esterase [Corallococcus sp. AB049A]|uniref:Acyl esterase n=1 Tax=Corallococcus interemptor TaxID=2316720 RepID=A0A3A8QTQ1_9BACT|nr:MULTISPECIES: CocE/NonD family hydrolase [Corallococcus]RKH49388.1 acyl esterase [Corallococcus sp. AB050B]RKH72179.1 acyl esterase [Corallococcus interemptor]RKI54947.1 acyl esterase [Corallococcus sp. AB049A]